MSEIIDNEHAMFLLAQKEARIAELEARVKELEAKVEDIALEMPDGPLRARLLAVIGY